MSTLTKTFADVTARVMLRRAVVDAVADHGTAFRSITLTGDGLRGATWNVGDKLQVRSDADGLSLRTYTPVAWDPATGRTRLLTYLHGTGPGSTWARTAATGDTAQVFGPRRSLTLPPPSTPLVLVGDETSFALAAAWHAVHPLSPAVATLFEVSDAEECSTGLDGVGVAGARLVARTDGDGHLPELTESLVDVLALHPEATLCLTGRAQTIAALRRALKGTSAADRTTLVKAYWDENRSGLD